MSQFFLAVITILCGGLFSLVLTGNKTLSRSIGVILISAGSLWGLLSSATSLMTGGEGVAAFSFLNVFEFVFRMDGLSAFFLMAIFLVCLVAAIYSYHYMDGHGSALGTAANYFFFSVLAASMALVVTAGNMISFLISWEIMSLSSFFLVIYNYQSEESRKAGFMYFVFSHVGVVFLFAGFGLMYGVTGTFGFDAAGAMPEGIKLAVFILTFIGFGSKAGVFPFHVWLPHAHPAAPSHISAVMSGCMIKTGIYGIFRVYTLLGLTTPAAGYLVLIAGIVSGILGVAYALGQNDIKRMLAYSSIENIGIILIGTGVGMTGVATGNSLMAALGFAGGMLHVLNHAVFKSLLFMGAGMVLHKTGTRSIDALGGLLKSMKITGTAFIVGSLAISGLPPFNGFVSEFFIYLGSFNGVGLSGGALVAGLCAIVSLAVIGGLALACFTKIIGIAFQGEPRTDAAVDKNEKGATMLLSMVALALACAVIGIFPAAFLNMALMAVGSLGLNMADIPLAPFGELTSNITFGAFIFLVLFILVAGIRALAYRGKPLAKSGTWGCGFTQPTVKMQYTGASYSGSILELFGPAVPVAEDHPPIQGRFPEKTYYKSQVNDVAEEQMNRRVVNPVLFFFDRLRWIQHGDTHLYIGYILLAIVLLLFFV
ncbi:MAG TPA: hydrogenase [Desulfobacteraceae bacterium]|nr:hydrogenase [Desulfobacteraceae bacterium]